MCVLTMKVGGSQVLFLFFPFLSPFGEKFPMLQFLTVSVAIFFRTQLVTLGLASVIEL